MMKKALQRLMGWVRSEPVRWHDLRRTTPLSRVFGFDRGQCIDRYYIESFLQAHAPDIRGRVLEVAEDTYTKKFGGDRVSQSDVLHAQPGNPRATVLGDLASGQGIPEAAFDCMIVTQTLHVIYKLEDAVRSLHRALRPGGVLLATLPGISQISRYDADRWGDYWRLTTLSARRLFGEVFGPDRIEVRAHGNVLAAVAFLHGLASHELRRDELDLVDPDYELLITVRAARKGEGP